MNSTPWELRRRDLLRSLGVGLACLPILQATNARAAGTAKNFIFVVQPQGYRQERWRPQNGPLAPQILPFASSPLEPYKDALLYLLEMTNPGAPGGAGGYATLFSGGPGGGAAFREPTRATVDQAVAGILPKAAHASLAFGVQTDLPPVAQSTADLRCFWRGPGQPITPELDPIRSYARLFGNATGGNGASDEAAKALVAERRSILDYVGRSIDRWKRRLGNDEKVAIDAHSNAIRELEMQLGSTAPAETMKCIPDPPPVGLDSMLKSSFPPVLDAFLSLAFLSLRCGATHVATVQISNSTADNVDVSTFVPGVPAGRTWADTARMPVLNGVDHKAIVDRYMMSRLANLLGKLKQIPDEGKTMLDTSMVVWANTMESGDLPSARIPWVLAGSAGGYLKTGQCLTLTDRPLAGVLTEICKSAGASGDLFGPSVPGLKNAA